MVQKNAGGEIGLTDEQYLAVGGVGGNCQRNFRTRRDDREGQRTSTGGMRDAAPGQILYTYLHLAPDPEQTAALVKSGAICIAYETITGANGGLPCWLL